jgi:hypothetical protein
MSMHALLGRYSVVNLCYGAALVDRKILIKLGSSFRRRQQSFVKSKDLRL